MAELYRNVASPTDPINQKIAQAVFVLRPDGSPVDPSGGSSSSTITQNTLTVVGPSTGSPKITQAKFASFVCTQGTATVGNLALGLNSAISFDYAAGAVYSDIPYSVANGGILLIVWGV